MRRLGVLALLAVTVTACGGGSSSAKATSGATQAALKLTVFTYTTDFLDGHGEQAWLILADSCQKQIGHDDYISTAQQAASLYKGLTVTSYKVDSFTPPTARVSYATAVKSLAKTNQLWLLDRLGMELKPQYRRA